MGAFSQHSDNSFYRTLDSTVYTLTILCLMLTVSVVYSRVFSVQGEKVFK